MDDRAQATKLSFGEAHAVYPEATANRGAAKIKFQCLARSVVLRGLARSFGRFGEVGRRGGIFGASEMIEKGIADAADRRSRIFGTLYLNSSS